VEIEFPQMMDAHELCFPGIEKLSRFYIQLDAEVWTAVHVTAQGAFIVVDKQVKGIACSGPEADFTDITWLHVVDFTDFIASLWSILFFVPDFHGQLTKSFSQESGLPGKAS
tara:strand:+ start:3878 stop:4213 length:336 start_codon:yes stop_codon:yes gene_type:complete